MKKKAIPLTEVWIFLCSLQLHTIGFDNTDKSFSNVLANPNDYLEEFAYDKLLIFVPPLRIIQQF